MKQKIYYSIILFALLTVGCSINNDTACNQLWRSLSSNNDTIVAIISKTKLYIIEKEQNYLLLDSASMDSSLQKYIGIKNSYRLVKENGFIRLISEKNDTLKFSPFRDVSVSEKKGIIDKATFNDFLLGVWEFKNSNKEVSYCSIFNQGLISIRTDENINDLLFSNYHITDSLSLKTNDSSLEIQKLDSNQILNLNGKRFKLIRKNDLGEPLVLIQEDEIFSIDGKFLPVRKLKKVFWSYWLKQKFHSNFVIKVSSAVSFRNVSQTKELIKLMNTELKAGLTKTLSVDNDSKFMTALDEIYPCVVKVVPLEK